MGGLNVSPFDPAGWPGTDSYGPFNKKNNVSVMHFDFMKSIIDFVNAREHSDWPSDRNVEIEIGGIPLVVKACFRGRDSFSEAEMSFFVGRQDQEWGALLGFQRVSDALDAYGAHFGIRGSEVINRPAFERDWTVIRMFPEEWKQRLW